MWQPTITDNGKMATNWVMFQLQGMNGASAIMTMPARSAKQKSMLHLNRFAILGTSRKKLDRSTSLAVAPHCMSMQNMWERMA